MPELRRGRRALTPEQRSQRARIAANTKWGKTADRTAATAPATRAWNAKFEQLADPDGRMTPEQRARAAESLKRAHFQRMAYRSAQVRRARKQAG